MPVLTPSQVLPLPLLQSRCGTTFHHIHLPTFDATILITTSCVLFYFISPFLLLKSSLRNRYHTCCHCTGTTAMAYARGMTTQPCPQVCKPPRHCCILPLASHTHCCHCLIRGHASYVFFFSFFRPFSDQSYRDTLYPMRQVLKPPPLHCASPLNPRKSHHHHCLHSWAHK